MPSRILLRRADVFTSTEADVAEPFYDGNIKTMGVGDGTETPPRMLAENTNQSMTNKTIDAKKNILLNILPSESLITPIYGVSLLDGVVSTQPITNTIKNISPVLDTTAVNQLNANLSEIRSKLNQIILLLKQQNISA